MNIDELKELAALLKDIEPILDKFLRVLELAGTDNSKDLFEALLTPPSFKSRGEVCKLLKCGSATVTKLIEQKRLTPLYIPNTNAARFRLSEILKVLEERK